MNQSDYLEKKLKEAALADEILTMLLKFGVEPFSASHIAQDVSQKFFTKWEQEDRAPA